MIKDYHAGIMAGQFSGPKISHLGGGEAHVS